MSWSSAARTAPEPLATEIWDLGAQTATPLGTAIDRTGHRATLDADGRVRISDGEQISGRPATGGYLIDPGTGRVQRAPEWSDERGLPRLAAALPFNGATDVPVDTRVALRFSEPLASSTVHSGSIALAGPSGSVAAPVTAAEGGRLAFVRPAEALLEGTTYTLTVSGATDEAGVPVVPARLTFTTRSRASDADAA